MVRSSGEYNLSASLNTHRVYSSFLYVFGEVDVPYGSTSSISSWSLKRQNNFLEFSPTTNTITVFDVCLQNLYVSALRSDQMLKLVPSFNSLNVQRVYSSFLYVFGEVDVPYGRTSSISSWSLTKQNNRSVFVFFSHYQHDHGIRCLPSKPLFWRSPKRPNTKTCASFLQWKGKRVYSSFLQVLAEVDVPYGRTSSISSWSLPEIQPP